MEKREDMSSDDQREAMNNPDGDLSEVQLGKRRYENNIEEEADDGENDTLALSLTSCSYSNSTTNKPSLDSFSSSTHLSPQEITRPHYHEITISPLNPLPTQMLIPPPSQRLMTQTHDHGILIPPPPPPPQMMMNTSFPFNLQVHVSQPCFGYDGNDGSSNITVNHHQHQPAGPLQRAPRARGRPARIPREGRSETVPVLYPWATDRRARVHSLEYLRSKQIDTISGLVQCKKCDRKYKLGFNLEEKFAEIGNFIARYKSLMHDRAVAPAFWLNPVFPKCKYCNFENGVRPVMAENKKEINWLFLLLGQMLGFLTLEQLKYFCKHTKNHRTGAKDRVLYLTYLGLCKQLDPNGPFDR
ncbi:hypothetical protein K2173_013538 [Erythroxylum novogranatense]|uniref:DUF7086 domain-containing protein n=1 Tax=Erythroxylum novogranatense TaxID=1862640 RepID=A0AAV8TJR8_9ROSI|nr:hypothetical protein K2173_013538 [Erythroxylum novogranatense]